MLPYSLFLAVSGLALSLAERFGLRDPRQQAAVRRCTLLSSTPECTLAPIIKNFEQLYVQPRFS